MQSYLTTDGFIELVCLHEELIQYISCLSLSLHLNSGTSVLSCAFDYLVDIPCVDGRTGSGFAPAAEVTVLYVCSIPLDGL